MRGSAARRSPPRNRYVHRYNPGGAYVIFMMDDGGYARVQASDGESYARLAAVKQHDPTNLLRVNQNIKHAV